MAYTLADIAALKNDPIRAHIIKSMSEKNSVIQRIKWVHSADRAYVYVEDGVLPTVGFRGLNSAYEKSTGTYVEKVVNLRMLGSDAPIDQFLIDTNGGAIEDLVAGATRHASAALGLLFNTTFINGDSTTDPTKPSFDGLKKLVTGGQIVSTGANGMKINGADNDARYDFLDKLTELTSKVEGGANALFMNSQALAAIKSVGMRLGAVIATVDEFGRTVDTFDGIPMLDVGLNANNPQTQIILNNEVQGTNSDCTSIYAVRLDENGVHAVGTGSYFSARNLGESAEKPQQTVRVDGYAAVVMKGNSAARLTGVRV